MPENEPVLAIAARFLQSFKRPVRVLIAISGGSDSTGLLVALATLYATGNHPDVTLCACTVDHDLRAGSADEAIWVADLCKRYGISHRTMRWTEGKPASGVQAAARARRYAFLVEAAADEGAEAIVSAHTADDQTETIAMRAARAADGIGLSGMADAVLLHGAVWLFRPFLSLDRATIRTFLQDKDEHWLDDPSNSNVRFERARVRALGVPARMDQGAGSDRLSLAAHAGRFVAGNVSRAGGLFSIGPDGIDLAMADIAAWRGLLALAAAIGGRVHFLETQAASRLRRFLASGTLSRMTAGRVVFDRRRDGLHLYRECRDIPALTLPPGTKGIWDGRQRVVNNTDSAVVVVARGATGAGQGAPGLKGPALRASRADPVLDMRDPPLENQVRFEPRIAPYADFLPLFELPLARALADILGCSPVLPPPNE